MIKFIKKIMREATNFEADIKKLSEHVPACFLKDKKMFNAVSSFYALSPSDKIIFLNMAEGLRAMERNKLKAESAK